MTGFEEPTTTLSRPSNVAREGAKTTPKTADEQPGRRTISVTGQGTIAAPPNVADINVGVVTQASTAREALTANSGQMTALQALLKERGVESKDIQSTQISIQPQYSQPATIRQGQPQREFEPKLIGYRVQNMVRITARDLSNLGALLDATIEAGANQMDGIGFRIDGPEALLDAARKEAMSDARRKAELMAGEASVVVGQPITISDDFSPYAPPPPIGRSRVMAAVAVPVSAGEQTLGVTVHVVYELKTPT
jgi:uncharacterized protein YggE